MGKCVDMTVFDLFKQIEYGYVKLDRGTIFGNVEKINSETGKPDVQTLKGVFKYRSGYTRNGVNMESFNGESATLHAHPQDFDKDDRIVGNGVVVNGVEYEVVGISKGTNFDTGVVEHIMMTLKEANYAN